MAKNYVQEGSILNLPAPYAVTSGSGAKIGSIFGVATVDLASGAVGAFAVEDVWSLKKLSAEAWTVGAKIYWDDTAKQTTIVSTGNMLIGVATQAAANPSSVGVVRLNESFS